jgi:hypothetical protein
LRPCHRVAFPPAANLGKPDNAVFSRRNGGKLPTNVRELRNNVGKLRNTVGKFPDNPGGFSNTARSFFHNARNFPGDACGLRNNGRKLPDSPTNLSDNARELPDKPLKLANNACKLANSDRKLASNGLIFSNNAPFSSANDEKTPENHENTRKVMSDPTISPPTTPANSATPAPRTQPRGYFNQAQVTDIQTAEDLASVSTEPEVAGPLAGREITALYITGLTHLISDARAKMASTGQAHSGHQPATLNADDAERALINRLHDIQAAAKQKHRMLSEDDNPATNFSTSGYLIGERLNANRAKLLQNADTLKLKAATDSLPGYKTPEALAKIAADIAAYKSATATQNEREQLAEEDRIERDTLVKKLNARRTAIQHAADALWPYTTEANAPLRKRFKLQVDRPFNG